MVNLDGPATGVNSMSAYCRASYAFAFSSIICFGVGSLALIPDTLHISPMTTAQFVRAQHKNPNCLGTALVCGQIFTECGAKVLRYLIDELEQLVNLVGDYGCIVLLMP